MFRISIITICFNNPSELKSTLRSVELQTIPPYELIIIDGSTNEEIKTYLSTVTLPGYCKWVSEPDKGISDAFNKGIMMSTGDIIGILNSGDLLFDSHTLEIVNETFISNPGIAWCHGQLKIMRSNQWVIIGKSFDPSKLYRGMRSVAHPTMYLKRFVYDKVGLFNLNIKIAMDYDLLCRIASFNYIFIEKPLAIFDPDGISSLNYIASIKESYKIYRKYFGYNILQPIWYTRLYLLHKILNTPIGKILYKLKSFLGLESW
ncbi:MAG: glycosyltransferase family 2 protein [Saprospiraceae bacterium]